MTHTPSAPTPKVRLTALSHGAGCACKLGSVDLAEVLRHLPSVVDPRVLVDAAHAGRCRGLPLSDDRALVATTDFFTPIVDDPRAWGAIAAANALSDVYAMGGTPLFALNLVGWPRDKVPFEVLGEVLRGAVGGHRARALPRCWAATRSTSLEPLFGLVVIGEVHPDRALTNAGACAGDVLVLTKPLGTGILATALKRDALHRGRHGRGGPLDDHAQRGRRAGRARGGGQRRDRRDRVRPARPSRQHAGGEQGRRGDRLRVAADPAACAEPRRPRHRPRRHRSGTCAAAEPGRVGGRLTPTERILCVDAQTSGGLLLAVPPENEAALLAALARGGDAGGGGDRPAHRDPGADAATRHPT